MSENIEQQAAKTLLERGVKLSLPAPIALRLIGKKKLGFTVRQPKMGTLYRIASLYLGMGIDIASLDNTNMDDGFKLITAHGKTMCRIAAYAILNRFLIGKIFTGPLAWWIFKKANPAELYTIFYAIVIFSGVADFLNTIRLTSTMMITTPRNLSQEAQGSYDQNLSIALGDLNMPSHAPQGGL